MKTGDSSKSRWKYWQSRKREDKPSTITVQGQQVTAVEKFVYLGSLVHSTTQSYTKPRQSDLEVKNLHLNKAESV